MAIGLVEQIQQQQLQLRRKWIFYEKKKPSFFLVFLDQVKRKRNKNFTIVFYSSLDQERNLLIIRLIYHFLHCLFWLSIDNNFDDD